MRPAGCCVCTPGEQDEHLHGSLGVNAILVPLFCILLERMWSFVHPLCHSASHGQSCLSVSLTTGFPALNGWETPSDIDQWRIPGALDKPRMDIFC